MEQFSYVESVGMAEVVEVVRRVIHGKTVTVWRDVRRTWAGLHVQLAHPYITKPAVWS